MSREPAADQSYGLWRGALGDGLGNVWLVATVLDSFAVETIGLRRGVDFGEDWRDDGLG